MSSPLRRNLELKIRCSDLAAAREVALRLRDKSEREIQTDTFFHVRHGRLKLREIEGSPAVLIWYDRPNSVEARQSAYHLVPVSDPVLLHAALTAALGVRGVVQKRREIFLWHNVRIHLDEVEGLGTFVEFEAVLSSEEDEVPSRDRLEQLRQEMRLLPGDVVAEAYADLLGL